MKYLSPICMKNKPSLRTFILLLIPAILGFSCNNKKTEDKEQLTVSRAGSDETNDSTANSIGDNISIDQLSTTPNSVILTGLADHRLLSIYKAKTDVKKNVNPDEQSREFYYSYDGNEYDGQEHFMPGIDILYGYNLLNIAHYDMKTSKTNVLFKKSALIKTLYYPSFVQDSINKLPVNRNYYLISVYDEDTNKDKVINRKDLRKLYHIDAGCNTKTQLIPDNYCVMRSQYDAGNDAMFVFAKYDLDKNGATEKKEPYHVFCIDLKNPITARRMY